MIISKTICIKGLIIEHSIIPITCLKTLINTLLILLINTKPIKFKLLNIIHYNDIDDAVVNQNNTIYTNDNRNVTKNNKLINVTSNNYYTKKMEHTNNITINITNYNQNNYANTVIIKVNTHITHIDNYHYDEINHYNNKSLNTNN